MSLVCKLGVFKAIVKDLNLLKILKGKIYEVFKFKLIEAKYHDIEYISRLEKGSLFLTQSQHN